MASSSKAERIVKDMERDAPYMYEGLYGNFLRNYMEFDKSKWTSDLSTVSDSCKPGVGRRGP